MADDEDVMEIRSRQPTFERNSRIRLAKVSELLIQVSASINVRDDPGNGNNCGFLAVAGNLGVSEHIVRGRIAAAAPNEAMRAEIFHSATWLRWDHLFHFSEQGPVIISLTAKKKLATKPLEYALHGRVAKGGREYKLENNDSIINCMTENPNAVLLLCERDMHWHRVSKIE